MANFVDMIYTLQNMGVVDVILPFIIVFTIAFAALQKSKVLGIDSRKYNIIVALVMGFAVVVPHVLGLYPPNGDVVDIMNRALPNVSLIAIAFVMIMLILGIIGGEVNFAGTSLAGWAVLMSIIAVAVIFLAAADVFRNIPWWLNWTLDPYVREIIIVVLVFGVIIWFITKEDNKEKREGRGFKNMMGEFGKVIGGGKK